MGASVQSTTGSGGVRISGSNAGYTMFRGNVKSTGYPLHSPVSPSLPLPCVTVCHHILTGVYCVLKVYRYGVDLAAVGVFNLHELVGNERFETNNENLKAIILSAGYGT